MAFIKISDAFKAGADWISATVRGFFVEQVPRALDTVQDVRDNDLEQCRFLFVRAKNAFYRLNLSSTAADDGNTVIRDNIGRRYEKIGSPGTVEAVVSPDGSVTDIVAITQAEYDELDPPHATTFYVIVPE